VSKKLLLLVLCLVLPLSSGLATQREGSGSHGRSTKSENSSWEQRAYPYPSC